ncbi:MAG: GxxExxY protein [Acidobacteria bacterium]|nr:MAG: GxxExxY protein [Acidobacteriota bacterium]
MEVGVLDDVTEQIIGAAIAVHQTLGPGLLESAYESCLAFELTERNLKVERQRSFPLIYKSMRIESAYRIDLVVQGSVIVEIKALEQLLPVHQAQLLSYLRLASLPIGLLINFHVASLKNGIRRVVNSYSPSLRPPRSSASSALKGNAT